MTVSMVLEMHSFNKLKLNMYKTLSVMCALVKFFIELFETFNKTPDIPHAITSASTTQLHNLPGLMNQSMSNNVAACIQTVHCNLYKQRQTNTQVRTTSLS